MHAAWATYACVSRFDSKRTRGKASDPLTSKPTPLSTLLTGRIPSVGGTVELLVRARRAEQLLVGTALDDDPALDDADAVGVPDGRETMGDDT